MEIIAHPPPKVNAPIFMNVKNNRQYTVATAYLLTIFTTIPPSVVTT